MLFQAIFRPGGKTNIEVVRFGLGDENIALGEQSDGVALPLIIGIFGIDTTPLLLF